MKIQESGEMYLESIFLLQKKKAAVRAIDIVAFTGYSKPSVSRAMGLLKSGNLISVDSDGHIVLTEEGMSIATRMYERHTILTKLFIQLGVPESVAEEDACKIEHVISDNTFQALKNISQKF